MAKKTADELLIEKVNETYKGDKTVPYMGNNSLPDPKSTYEYDEDRVKVVRKCHEDIIFFANNFFYVVSAGKKRCIKLRDYQIRGLKLFQDYNKVIFNTSRQIGKALALDTPIPTPFGWTTMGEIKDGDIVYDETGKPCNVLYAHDILHGRECYEVEFDCGEKIIADKDHLWFTQSRTERKRRCDGSVKTTSQLLEKIICGKKNEPNHRIRKCDGVDGLYKELKLDPYLLGLWLGDGHKGASRISVGGDDLEQFLEVLPWKTYSIIEDKRNTVKYVNLLKENGNYFSHILRDIGIYDKKGIPVIYLESSREQRLELLRGLMDTDGTINRQDGSCSIDLSDEELMDTVVKLIKSLGYKTNIRLRYPKKDTHKISYRISFKTSDSVFKYKRKSILQKKPLKNGRINYHYIKNIKKVNSVPVRCITVDSPNSLYLCGENYIPTHNTTLMGIYAIWLATFFEYRKILIVANKADTAKEILGRIKLAYEELPNWIKPEIKGWNKLSVEFKNGSEIKISATSSDAARGQSLNCLLVDEAGHIEQHVLEEFWSAVYPTISNDPDARLIMSSTPNGVGNLFHDLWEKSQSKNSGWGSLSVMWHEIPGRGPEWEAEKRKDLGDDRFEQEYECKFLESGGSNIPEDLYNELQSECINPRIELPNFEGYKIYKEPDLENRLYVAGVDIAEGVGKCNSTIQVLDVTDMTKIEQVAVYANNTIGPNEFARQLNEIMKHWGKPPLAIERNNTGGGVVITLMENDYHYPCLINFANKQGRIDYGHLKGITSSTNTKSLGVYNMFYFLKTHRRVKLRDMETLTELNTFVKHKNERWARKSESYLDDRVDALIWALIAVHENVATQYFTISMWDDNKKPFALEPLYEIYGRKEGMRLGHKDNNWGVDNLIMPTGDFDPSMTEMFDAGWLTPEMDRASGFRSYEPSPYQFL